jgi:hypothetical protein
MVSVVQQKKTKASTKTVYLIDSKAALGKNKTRDENIINDTKHASGKICNFCVSI